VHRGGYSVLELVFVLSLSLTVGAAAVPQFQSGLDAYRAAGAARYIAGRLQRARMEAVMRSVEVALRFSSSPGSGYSYAVYVDGNGNGVLSTDIQSGADRMIGAAERLRDNFSGVDFGAIPGLPPVDAGGTPPGSNPVRLGSGSSASFSPDGTSSSGSLYVLGARNTQFVIRLYGETARVRVLRFDNRMQQWRPL
jgi:Type II transport protein GspH